ncbi:unnamed protein product, partial [Musa banksii]
HSFSSIGSLLARRKKASKSTSLSLSLSLFSLRLSPPWIYSNPIYTMNLSRGFRQRPNPIKKELINRFWSVVNDDGSSAIAWSILLSQNAAAGRSSPFPTDVEMQLLLTEHFIPCCGRSWKVSLRKPYKLLFFFDPQDEQHIYHQNVRGLSDTNSSLPKCFIIWAIPYRGATRLTSPIVSIFYPKRKRKY